MNRIFVYAAVVFTSPILVPAATYAVTISTVPVGNPGNAADSTTGCGAVAYKYRIGKTEVTNAQYVEFLNAKAANDPLELYSTEMGVQPLGGITRSGANGSYSYAAKPNMGDKPVNYVSWYDAVRFANWLNNGQGDGDTETGAYTIYNRYPDPSGSGISRNPGATWFLTSEDEWYKAAYYQPAANGGDADDYWLYPTASNFEPTIATTNDVGDITNPGSNVANYNRLFTGTLTTVGSAGALSESYYGTSDQGGNVAEWNESLISGMARALRGGSCYSHPNFLKPTEAFSLFADQNAASLGFRVATVPEPSTAVLAIIGSVLIWGLGQRFK